MRAWLLEQGFKDGDPRGTAEMDGWRKMCPLARACEMGELRVCKGLYTNGAAADITKPDMWGFTPMLWACSNGKLSVCKWLFEVGAAADISKRTRYGHETAMHLACNGGHLSVCKWLFEVGAAADLNRRSRNGATPMCMACEKGHLAVCDWLIGMGGEEVIRGWLKGQGFKEGDLRSTAKMDSLVLTVPMVRACHKVCGCTMMKS